MIETPSASHPQETFLANAPSEASAKEEANEQKNHLNICTIGLSEIAPGGYWDLISVAEINKLEMRVS